VGGLTGGASAARRHHLHDPKHPPATGQLLRDRYQHLWQHHQRANATLTVTCGPRPQIDSITLMPAGQVLLQVSGVADNYAVEATTNLVIGGVDQFHHDHQPFSSTLDSETNCPSVSTGAA